VPDWRRQVKDYFAFSKTERRGIFLLLSVLVLLILINVFLPFFIKSSAIDFSEFEKQIALFEASGERLSDSVSYGYDHNRSANIDYSQKITPFEFDPNGLPAEQWKRLGLEDWQIKVIKNFEAKGGKFRMKEDLAKIYSIHEQEYRILEPYIRIKDTPGEKNANGNLVSSLNPFPFDPNNLTKDEGLRMGMRESVVNAIISFREKGGKFYSTSDLKKIYTLTDEEFAIIEPYVSFATDTLMTRPVKKSVVVELNTADTLDLQQLRGIGPSFARRIVKYREMLGGFCKPEQLFEVYGMDSTRYSGIASMVKVDRDQIKKININKVSIKEMMKHPYIEFYVAKSIINYRNEKGAFTDISQIREAKLIYNELFLKIEPYLSVK
jgi:competence ComEA-like helix-hairpin-helix protein